MPPLVENHLGTLVENHLGTLVENPGTADCTSLYCSTNWYSTSGRYQLGARAVGISGSTNVQNSTLDLLLLRPISATIGPSPIGFDL